MAATKNQTTVEKKHVVKAGGAKGQAIVDLMRTKPELTRQQLADTIGATVGRVGEVVRFLAAEGTKDEKAVIAAHVKAQPARKVAEKKASPTKASTKKAASASPKAPAKPAAPKTRTRVRKPALAAVPEPSPES